MARKEKSPRAIRVGTDSGLAVNLGMGTRYAPLREEDLELILALATGKTLTEISQERGRYDEWASHRLKACMQKYAAENHVELVIKLIALGQIKAEAIWNE